MEPNTVFVAAELSVSVNANNPSHPERSEETEVLWMTVGNDRNRNNAKSKSNEGDRKSGHDNRKDNSKWGNRGQTSGESNRDNNNWGNRGDYSEDNSKWGNRGQTSGDSNRDNNNWGNRGDYSNRNRGQTSGDSNRDNNNWGNRGDYSGDVRKSGTAFVNRSNDNNRNGGQRDQREVNGDRYNRQGDFRRDNQGYSQRDSQRDYQRGSQRDNFDQRGGGNGGGNAAMNKDAKPFFPNRYGSNNERGNRPPYRDNNRDFREQDNNPRGPRRDQRGPDNGRRGNDENRRNLVATFRFPRHQTPEHVAHSFTFQPYLSLKIDGVFKLVSPEKYSSYNPPFPANWTKVEGEYFCQPGQSPIFYVFSVQVDHRDLSIEEMTTVMSEYFENQTGINVTRVVGDDEDPFQAISEDLLIDINRSFEWRTRNPVATDKKFNYDVEGCCWYPKKYWKLRTHRNGLAPRENWNEYVRQLDQLFAFVHTERVLQTIAHDGLVITPNVTGKKHLLKFKPKNELTIDLFFDKNGKFVSGDHLSCDDFLSTNYDPAEYKANRVYRLYPDEENKFRPNPASMREPGKRANSRVHVEEIDFKLQNYFEISQLYDLYDNPWYEAMNNNGWEEMLPVFTYCQNIYKSIIAQMNHGSILDIGCGASGQYHKLLHKQDVTEYIGLDIDLAKLHEGHQKFEFDPKYKFVLLNISHPWNEQDQFFPHHIWNTFYQARARLLYSMSFDNILSVFSSHYANESVSTWKNYVHEINTRAQSGTHLFIEFIDSDKIDRNRPECQFYSFYANAEDPERGELIVRLPHRPSHTEPSLSYQTIINSFCNVESDQWIVENEKSKVHKLPKIDENVPISQYIKLVNWIVLKKL